MNLVFNELSVQPLVENDHTLKDYFLNVAETLKEANAKFGFSHIVFPSDIGRLNVTSSKSFYQWAHSIPHQGDKNKILSLIKRPFSDDVLLEQLDELNTYFFEHTELGIELSYCNGLATAYILETPALSLCTHAFWKQEQIVILKEDIETNIQPDISVFNLSDKDSLVKPNFLAFAETIAKVDIIESDLAPDDKSINLRDDHGKDILNDFAKRLRKSKYIVSVINSLPFNPKTVRFIKKIMPDGKIELVLHWEDKGLGVIIQTTGRNYRETKAISEILSEEYGK